MKTSRLGCNEREKHVEHSGSLISLRCKGERYPDRGYDEYFTLAREMGTRRVEDCEFGRSTVEALD
jgi:hypothetical protein